MVLGFGFLVFTIHQNAYNQTLRNTTKVTMANITLS